MLDTYINQTEELYTVTIDGEEIQATAEHPFYTTEEGWVSAKDLEEGDHVPTADGEEATVEKVEREELDEAVEVYNFNVMDYHTYYVGENGVLVHNKCNTPESPAGESGTKTVNGYEAKVNVGQQNKHILGTNEYKNALNNGQTKSILYGDTNDIQNLLNQKAGTGDFLSINKERVDFGKIIGQYIDPDIGIGKETTMGIIHYGKKGAHIVPARPN